MGMGKAVDRLGRATASGMTEWTADRPSRRSLKALHLTLQKITEVLAHELGSPTAAAPEWSETEWAVARAVAAIHGVSPLLAEALRWQGPAGWRQFLVEQKTHTAKRFLRIQELLELIDGHARRDGLALVPLKGAALHASGIYVPGERPMADLDLLVEEAQLAPAVRRLTELGFRETSRTWKHRVFELDADHAPAALGEHASNGIKIELHHRVREILPLRAVDLSQVVWPEPPRPGLNSYPSKAALLMHLLLHAAGAMVGRGLRLLQLHDIARLSEGMNDEDWEEVLRLAARTDEGSLWWAFPPLTLTRRYYSCVPDRVMARAASDCPWMLRRVYRSRTLAGTSVSHLWITAFPGIEWARSPRGMFQYAAARVAPGAETVQLRSVFAAKQPLVSGGTWAQLSQRQRMLRWIMSPQARHETLQPVRAALRDMG